MDKNEILYERVGHLITIAASDSPETDFPDLIIDDESVIFSVSFSNYVKSQIHLNIVSGLFGRKIQEYKYALDYLYGKCEFNETVLHVLHYFYIDMLNFLRNNKRNISVEIIVDYVPAEYFSVSFEEAVNEFSNLLDNLELANFDETVLLLSQSEIREIVDYVDSLEEMRRDSNRINSMVFLLKLLNKEADEIWN